MKLALGRTTGFVWGQVNSAQRLSRVKLVLEVLAVLVTLIGGVLAIVAGLRK